LIDLTLNSSPDYTPHPKFLSLRRGTLISLILEPLLFQEKGVGMRWLILNKKALQLSEGLSVKR